MSAAPRGLRRDVPLVLGGALLVFVALAGFTLLSYRDAVRALVTERETEATALADRLARAAARDGGARIEPLAPLLPAGAALVLYDPSGRPLASLGHAAPPPLTVGGVAPGHLLGATALGPEATGLPGVVGLAPYPAGDERRFLRVDLPAAALAGRLRGLAWLTPLVLALSLSAAALLVVSVRALARPYEQLLEKARQAGAPLEGGRDELTALVETFDRALAALSARPAALDRLREALGGELDGGFLLLGPDGDVLAATPTASELLGIDPPTPGTPLRAALAARAELAELLAAAVASGEPLPRGAVDLVREGAPGTLGVTAEPLRGGEGQPRAWLVVVADHTELERRAAQERLADGLAQLGELSAGVAHELRNSLAALSGWVALAQREPLPPAAGECLAEITRESARISRVVEDFLAFARPGTRRLETVDLAAVARHAAHDPSLGGHAIALEAVAGAELRGDPELLERVLLNLLSNAVRAARSAAGGPVGLRVEPASGGWRVLVDDRGPGIPDSVRDRLFSPFSSASPDGAGLGLALARRIVLLHGGTIRVADREGGGTRVELWFPSDASATKGNGRAPHPNS